MRVVALPGLDGTGDLLSPFAAASGATIVRYPVDRLLTFDDYVDLAAAAVDDETLLIAESFSGPIAVAVAARKNIGALVLCATFVTAPLPRLLRRLPLQTLARLQAPEPLLSRMMLAP